MSLAPGEQPKEAAWNSSIATWNDPKVLWNSVNVEEGDTTPPQENGTWVIGQKVPYSE